MMDCPQQSLKSFSGDRFGCLAVLNGSSDRPELACSEHERLLAVSRPRCFDKETHRHNSKKAEGASF